MAQIFQSDRARAASHTPARAGAERAGPQSNQLSDLQQKADAGRPARELGAIQRQAETVQRQPEEEEALQGKAEGAALQRQEEEEALQGKAAGAALQRQEEEEALQGKAEGAALQRQEEENLQMKPASGGSALPSQLQSGIEALSGQSMDHVRVHRNSDSPAAVGAHAYAQGSDIHLAPGQERHLPHEAWHTVQQAEGRVPATTDVGGVAVNDSPALEREADTMGNKAAGK